LLRKAKKILLVVVSLLIAVGCATTEQVKVKETGKAAVKAESTKSAKSFFAISPSDNDIFNEALSYLENDSDEDEPDYDGAKEKFQELIKQYPKSKWRQAATDLIRALDQITLLQARVNNMKNARDKAVSEKNRLVKENDTVKKENKILEEKYQNDTAKLKTENEQLKNDIQLLKNLEIKLDKRDKLLR